MCSLLESSLIFLKNYPKLIGFIKHTTSNLWDAELSAYKNFMYLQFRAVGTHFFIQAQCAIIRQDNKRKHCIMLTDMTAKNDEYIICRMRLEDKRT